MVKLNEPPKMEVKTSISQIELKEQPNEHHTKFMKSTLYSYVVNCSKCYWLHFVLTKERNTYTYINSGAMEYKYL